jgi:hypothetical protein
MENVDIWEEMRNAHWILVVKPEACLEIKDTSCVGR